MSKDTISESGKADTPFVPTGDIGSDLQSFPEIKTEEYQTSQWNGFERIDFRFDGRRAIVVFPEQVTSDNKWLFKTEYFDAFPAFEIEMLRRGYALAYIENKTRWCLPEDIDVKAKFSDFLQKAFHFNKKCLPVGMSCGGLHAVYFAGKYPEYVAALYLDAPVLNLLSCPCGVGLSGKGMYDEFVAATGYTVYDMINYRNHPIDWADHLIRAGIPVFLVCGDSDTTVPYTENGKVLYEKYKCANAVIEQIVKKDCDHHPHGLTDHTPLIRFVQKYY